MCLLNGGSARTLPALRAREEAGHHVVRANRKGTVKENNSVCLLERSWGTDAKQEHSWFLPRG